MDKHATVPDAEPTLEVTAPIRIDGQSNAEAVFAWMRLNQYLWMLDGEWADRVEKLVGTARLQRLSELTHFCSPKLGHPA